MHGGPRHMADSVVSLAEKIYQRAIKAPPPLSLNINMLLQITTMPSQTGRTVTGLKQCELTRLFITCKK